jgi:hypothetical protein
MGLLKFSLAQKVYIANLRLFEERFQSLHYLMELQSWFHSTGEMVRIHAKLFMPSWTLNEQKEGQKCFELGYHR